MNSKAIPYPPQLIDRMCRALGYGGRDREYMHRVFSRHERGKATLPERALLVLFAAMVAPVPTTIVVPAEEDTEFEINVRKRMCKPEDAKGEPPCADLVPFNGPVPSDEDERADEKPWGVGYLVFH